MLNSHTMPETVPNAWSGLIMHKWIATVRCDWEETFTTETMEFVLDTYVLSDAAFSIELKIGSHYTLIRLERDV